MRFSRRAGVAAGIAILSLTACNGGGSSPSPTGVTNGGDVIPAVGGAATPGTSAAPGATASSTAGATASPVTVATSVPGNGSSSNGNLTSGLSQVCTTAVAPIGSNVVVFNVAGNVTGTTFTPSTSTVQSNDWIKTRVVLDVTPTVGPLPTFTPFPVSTETPSPTVPVYLYSGSYTVNNTNGSVDASGCALFVATVNGSPLNSASSNATGFGSPRIAENATFDTTNSATGRFSAFSIGNLSNNGGSGSFTLDNGETGTISLNRRTSYDYPALALQSRGSLKRQATSIFRR